MAYLRKELEEQFEIGKKRTAVLLRFYVYQIMF